MRKYINILFLFGFICLWLNQEASQHDRHAVRAGINKLFNEPNPANEIDWSKIFVYRVIAHTNVTGWFLPIDEAGLENLNVDLSNITTAKLNTWATNNMDNPNHLRWKKGDDWKQVAIEEGIEKVPVSPSGPTDLPL